MNVYYKCIIINYKYIIRIYDQLQKCASKYIIYNSIKMHHVTKTKYIFGNFILI